MSGFGLPILPETAPFPAEHIEVLNAVMAQASAEQRHWLSGFLAGYHAALTSPAALPMAAPAAPPRKKSPLTVLYGTDSGNAEGLADAAKKAAAKAGFAVQVVDMADTDPAEMAKAERLLVITSTWGEGDPPERAAPFYRALMADDAPRFDGVPFSVLALGDSSYVNFCETGRQIDARLEALGGRRIAARVDCDLDYEEPAASWTQQALKDLADQLEPEPAAKGVRSNGGVGRGPGGGEVINFPSAAAEPLYGKAHPFPAEVTEIANLNGSRSGKQTIHLELSLAGSGLVFEPGDSLGIVTENRPETVEAVLRAAGLTGDAELAARLAREWDITTLSRPVLEAYAALNPTPALAELLAGAGWRGYLAGRQLLDLLEDFPLALTAEQLTGLLRKLPSRLYSVASSLKAVPDEAHLLVGVVRYESHGRERHGVASTFVAERLRAGDKLKVYVKPNRNFRLPDDHDRPVIMIGPGTGVAPFRAFLQERQAARAKGRNWLFFGDRNYTHDFLYQLEWQELHKDGVLNEIDVAFSRDQPEKVYVQHRMWQRREELFGWLEDGAHLYVCGDEKAMAKDVHAMLAAIVARQGQRSTEAAEAYLSDLKKQHRYQRDVY
ncbi:MAG TPA: assimilatory sulfite reductase (NADPH) flavoprotein subunit [Geminicoccaceae bacterium]|nr:assimilatory sulfite reductase (NADPH) flavoprotein subunit [Geminicoccaceae bacterium]